MDMHKLQTNTLPDNHPFQKVVSASTGPRVPARTDRSENRQDLRTAVRGQPVRPQRRHQRLQQVFEARVQCGQRQLGRRDPILGPGLQAVSLLHLRSREVRQRHLLRPHGQLRLLLRQRQRDQRLPGQQSHRLRTQQERSRPADQARQQVHPPKPRCELLQRDLRHWWQCRAALVAGTLEPHPDLELGSRHRLEGQVQPRRDQPHRLHLHGPRHLPLRRPRKDSSAEDRPPQQVFRALLEPPGALQLHRRQRRRQRLLLRHAQARPDQAHPPRPHRRHVLPAHPASTSTTPPRASSSSLRASTKPSASSTTTRASRSTASTPSACRSTPR